MSILQNAKEFFGLSPQGIEGEDAYYEEDTRYETAGSAAYQPRYADYGEEDGYGREPRTRLREHHVEEPRYAPRRRDPEIVTLDLVDFEDVKRLGEAFRDGDVVIFDVARMESRERRRVVDFASGLCFGLVGTMDRLDQLTFVVLPEGCRVPAAELKRAAGLR